MSVPKDILASNEGLSKWAIVLAYRGSVAHNMHCPSTEPDSIDDIDLMGVCVPPEKYYLGMSTYGSDGTQEIKREQNGELYDIVVYELKKFMRLLMNGNPNVLSLLWLRDNYYIKTSEAFRTLKEHRDLFVGKHVYHSFVGYAHGQLKRMTHYNRDEVLELEAELIRRGIDPASL